MNQGCDDPIIRVYVPRTVDDVDFTVRVELPGDPIG